MEKHRKILVIDDDANNLELIEDILAPYFSVTTCQDSSEALQLARSLLPDVVLLDITMPKLDGITLCEMIRNTEATRQIWVIMVSAADDLEHRVRAFSVGADDFIGRPFKPKELVARVQSKTRRVKERERQEENLICGNLNMNIQKLEATINGHVVPLSVLDFSLLKYFVQNKDRVISRTRILEAVWRDAVVSDRTVDTHIAYMRKKLTRFGFDHNLATVYGAGYVLKTPQRTSPMQEQQQAV